MKSHPEKILCISRKVLFKDGDWRGLKQDDLEKYIEMLRTSGELKVRDEVEGNTDYLQVIVQAVVRYKDKFFLHKQLAESGGDLNSLYPLSLGGHVEEKDFVSNGDVFKTAIVREVAEELDIKSNIVDIQFLGVIYIENEAIATRTHIGLVYIMDIDGTDVHVRENGLEDIGFVSLDYLKENVNLLAFWSRVILFSL